MITDAPLRPADIDLWDPALKGDPGPTFVGLSQAEPFHVEIGGGLQAVVCRHADARTAMVDHERFSNVKRPWPGTEKFYYWQGLPVVTDTDPPTHSRLRMLLNPAFSPKRLAQVEAGVQDWVGARLDDIARGGGGFDAVADLGRPLALHMLLGLLMDIPEDDRQLFVAVSEGLSLFSNLGPGETAPAAYVEAWGKARAYCEALIERRRRERGEDLVSQIISAHDEEQRITTDELFASLVILYIAGLSSVAHLIGWLLWRLCREPKQLAALQGDPGLLAGALEESLRRDPIGYLALRYATHDFAFEGLPLSAGMPVIVVEAASGFDPHRHPDPLRFDIRRERLRENLAFGYGVHHCIGAPVARMAARAAVGQCVQRFGGLRLSEPDFIPAVVGGPKDRGPARVPLLVD